MGEKLLFLFSLPEKKRMKIKKFFYFLPLQNGENKVFYFLPLKNGEYESLFIPPHQKNKIRS